MWIFFLALVTQFTFLTSVFDIYLKTSIVDGIEPEKRCNWTEGAKRMVLFISDGLRSDILFSMEEDLALRRVATERGRWGISKSRMPTRSLQGTITIGSGIYTDPVAFIKLWEKSALRVDTIFDRATGVFYFGHPSVMSYFSGSTSWAVPRPLNLDWKDMRPGKGTARLDEAVIDAVSDFLKGAKTDERLFRSGLVFFIHMSGIDYGAHKTGIYSQNMRDNVMALDRGIARLERELNEFYSDEKTAYVFTSDHGTTRWGSHGGSSPGETDTPLIVWGPRVGGPTWRKGQDHTPSGWRMGNVTRRDVRQIDLAPLMAALLGVPVPVNSIGHLPYEYLKEDDKLRAEATACNAFQLATLASRAGQQINNTFDPAELREEISAMIAKTEYVLAINKSLKLMTISDEVFQYHQKYYTNLIYNLTILAFAGWALALLSYVLPSFNITDEVGMCSACLKGEGNNNIHCISVCCFAGSSPDTLEKYTKILIHVIFSCLLAVAVVCAILMKWPLHYCAYAALPVVLWWYAASRIFNWISFFRNLDAQISMSILTMSVVYAGMVEFLKWSFNMRYPLSIGMALIALVPKYRATYEGAPRTLISLWFLSSAALEGLLFYPVIGQPHSTFMVIMSLSVVIAVGVLYSHLSIRNTLDYILSVFGLLFVSGALLILERCGHQVSLYGEASTVVKVLSYIFLSVVVFPPILGTDIILNKLFLIALYYSVPVFLLSTRHEPFTLLVLYVNISCWLMLECRADGLTDLMAARSGVPSARHINEDDARRAAIFTFYLIFSYIVMGNYDDISSFDLKCVRCFTSEMNELLMGFLIMMKILFVFLPLVAAYVVLCSLTRVDPSRSFALVVLIVNVIGFRFFSEFSEKGPQWEISQNLSHHCFTQLFICFLIFSYIIARLFVYKSSIGCKAFDFLNKH